MPSKRQKGEAKSKVETGQPEPGLLSKRTFLLFLTLVTIAPFATGGRDNVWLLVLQFTLVLGLFLTWRLPKPAVTTRDGLAVAAVAFGAWATLSLWWSVNRYQTFQFVLLYWLAVGAFTLAKQAVPWWRQTLRLLDGYYILALAAALIGFYFYLTGQYPRLTSTFYWPNPAAAFFLPAALLSGWEVVKGKRLYALAAVPIGAAFILTDSRGAALSAAVIVVLGLAKTRPSRLQWSRLLLTAAAILALSSGVIYLRDHKTGNGKAGPTTVGARYTEVLKDDSSSLTDRANYWRSAISIWRAHPLIGTGAGTYATMHPKFQLQVTSAAAEAHNVYLQVLSELGAVGFLLLFLLLAELLLGGLRMIKADPRRLAMLLALAALLLHFGLDIDTSYPSLLMLAAVLAALVYLPDPTRPTVKPAAGLSLAAILILLPFGVANYRSNLLTAKAEKAQQDFSLSAAADYYKQAHQLLIYNPDNLVSEGIMYYSQAHFGQDVDSNLNLARERARQAAKLDPDSPQPALLLARTEYIAGNDQLAIAAYKRVLELDPYNLPDAYADLARAYLVDGHLDEALTTTNQGIALYPDPVVAHRSNDTTVIPNVSNLYTIRANIEASRSQNAAAKSDAEHAVRLNPKNQAAAGLLQQLSQ